LVRRQLSVVPVSGSDMADEGEGEKADKKIVHVYPLVKVG